MKFCAECNSSPLPYLMVALIATIIGLITWLTLGLSTDEPLVRIGGSIAVFLAVGGTLWHYVASCIQRHCRHQQRYARAPTTPRT
jgi:hypothetical protein